MSFEVFLWLQKLTNMMGNGLKQAPAGSPFIIGSCLGGRRQRSIGVRCARTRTTTPLQSSCIRAMLLSRLVQGEMA